MGKMSNDNSRTHLILKLAREATERQNYGWEVREEEVDVFDIQDSELIQNHNEDGPETLSNAVDIEAQLEFPVEINVTSNQRNPRLTEDCTVVDDQSLSDPFSTDDSNADPDYDVSEETSTTSSLASSLINEPATLHDESSGVKKRKVLNASKSEKKAKSGHLTRKTG
ncbi:unnamed protein product [Acanthoscelides obtectus]|uniref:Uncharacterized protein n=1 Tax=Acanthoscelides obtectus TaxID=200917 RepID=A0A9P0PKB5_ACAOB|nr:unnamed protein product [Acanthoscelides obtectus]CAH2017966.1 unnamed protein product [Acanthoscelides obtectus]CAK1653496.1 hypothetical protein AOBTE_LOCUS18259 [Acanthoscelides obtectus]CAK1683889.1 hypothetical protein AOBTE_LOCUS34506 [Acanthoscelides obtectus]